MNLPRAAGNDLADGFTLKGPWLRLHWRGSAPRVVPTTRQEEHYSATSVQTLETKGVLFDTRIALKLTLRFPFVEGSNSVGE